MAKSAPKTMRFDKFHKLVKYFKDTEKEKKEEIKALDKAIKDREKRLQELNKKLSSVSWLENSFRQLSDDMERLKRGIGNCDRAIRDVIQS